MLFVLLILILVIYFIEQQGEMNIIVINKLYIMSERRKEDGKIEKENKIEKIKWI